MGAALYISPKTAENGGTPHFPDYIKGDYGYPGCIACGDTNNSVRVDKLPAGLASHDF